MSSYKDLVVYQIAFQLAREVHLLMLKLPKQEAYELASQVRRSAQSVRANIVEGYGRRIYKADYVRFLANAHASLLETISHLEMLKELYPSLISNDLLNRYEELGGKIYNYMAYVQKKWRT